jgi:hypothetical protein
VDTSNAVSWKSKVTFDIEIEIEIEIDDEMWNLPSRLVYMIVVRSIQFWSWQDNQFIDWHFRMSSQNLLQSISFLIRVLYFWSNLRVLLSHRFFFPSFPKFAFALHNALFDRIPLSTSNSWLFREFLDLSFHRNPISDNHTMWSVIEPH